MNVIEAIRARRAVRTYSSRRVDDATVKSLLQAAVQAPSAMNEQLWIFGVVQDTRQLARWSDRAKSMLLEQASADPKNRHYSPLLSEPSFNISYDASTLVVIGSKVQGRYTDADCWLAAENLMLAACEVGLGSCPIGFAIPLLNTPQVKEELRFPASAVVVAPILLGYPSAAVPAIPRAEPQILSWTGGGTAR
jgi:nitroreductase